MSSVAESLAWQADGLCASHPVDLWNSDTHRIGEGQAICRRCPVKERCLAHALETPGCLGIWGATSERERRRMRRARARS